MPCYTFYNHYNIIMPHMSFLSSRLFGTSPTTGAAKLHDMIQQYYQHGRRRSSSQSSRRTCGSNEIDSLEDSTSHHHHHRLSHIISKHFAKKPTVVHEHEIELPKELEELRKKYNIAKSETSCASVSLGSVYYREDYITCEEAISEMTEAWSLLMDHVDHGTWRGDLDAQALDMEIKALLDDFAALPRIDFDEDDWN